LGRAKKRNTIPQTLWGILEGEGREEKLGRDQNFHAGERTIGKGERKRSSYCKNVYEEDFPKKDNGTGAASQGMLS